MGNYANVANLYVCEKPSPITSLVYYVFIVQLCLYICSVQTEGSAVNISPMQLTFAILAHVHESCEILQ